MYRFGSALSEVHDFVSSMHVGDEKTFCVDLFSSLDSIEKFRARLTDVAKDNGWVFVTRKSVVDNNVVVRRIK